MWKAIGHAVSGSGGMADTMISPLDAPLLDSGRLAIEASISRRCRFQGFLNQSRLPEFYCLIDLLILPSIQGEVFGGGGERGSGSGPQRPPGRQSQGSGQCCLEIPTRRGG